MLRSEKFRTFISIEDNRLVKKILEELIQLV